MNPKAITAAGYADYAALYLQPRRFQDPILKITETVGVQSVLWAFVFGPLFYWKKGARTWGALMALAAVPALEISHDGSGIHITLSEIPYLSAVLWALFAFLAPVLLTMHYRHKRWIELP